MSSNASKFSAFLFLQLAEAGHEVAQMNLAHLLDTQKVTFLTDDGQMNRFYAQRFYELSADQGSASSELRLGDFAYYGWGKVWEGYTIFCVSRSLFCAHLFLKSLQMLN